VNAAITIKETIVKYRAAKNDDDGEKISEQAMEMAKIYRLHEILEKKKNEKPFPSNRTVCRSQSESRNKTYQLTFAYNVNFIIEHRMHKLSQNCFFLLLLFAPPEVPMTDAPGSVRFWCRIQF
jgi:hypothetical protein